MSQNHPHDNIYSILGKLDALKPTPQEKHDATVKAIYESVEAQGSILKGLRTIDPIETRLAEAYAKMGPGGAGAGDITSDTCNECGMLESDCGCEHEEVAEVITKKTPAGEIASDFAHSKNPMFKGDSKKQRIKRAMGAYYGMHPEKSKVKESTVAFKKALLESVNFRKMAEEADMTMNEMLEAIERDIDNYRKTGDMSANLRDYMHLHNHIKKQMDEIAKGPSFAPQYPSGQDVLPAPTAQPGVLGKIGGAIKTGAQAAGKALVGPNDKELLDRLAHDVGNPNRYNEDAALNELNELARLAGVAVKENTVGEEVADEGNAFTGKLKSTPKGDKFELDGKEYTDTSSVDEEVADEGNAFTGKLKNTPKGGKFELDGKEYTDTSSIDEGADYGNLENEMYYVVDAATGEVIDGPFNNVGEIPLRLMGFDGGHKVAKGAELKGQHVDEVSDPVNQPDEEYMSMDASTMNPGEGDFGEKAQHPDRPTFKNGDNPLARPATNEAVLKLEARLAAEYESIKKSK